MPPPPGLDSGDPGTQVDPGPDDVPGTDLPDGTGLDPGGDVAPVVCTTNDDCRKMPGLGPCIVGRCDNDSGTCWRVMLADGADCDDGDPCTTPDWCVQGECMGQPTVCDDGNPCTEDFCNPAGLCNVNPITGPCEDGNACTGPDRCEDGNCVGGPPVSCDDGDPCTGEDCDPAHGCLFPVVPDCKPCQSDGDCGDDNPCTRNPCVQNRCGAAVPLPDGDPCDDHDPCSTDSRCDNGLCAATAFKVCSDGNPCTDDRCDQDGNCVYPPVSGPACNDGDPCTLKDFCGNGECVGGKPVNCDDGDVCTRDYCVPPKVGCPGVLSTPGAAYQCCHVGCSEPNPTCTTAGCQCGKGLVCDPATADRCVQSPSLPVSYECKCGLGAACKPGYCCVNGQCNDICPIPK